MVVEVKCIDGVRESDRNNVRSLQRHVLLLCECVYMCVVKRTT